MAKRPVFTTFEQIPFYEEIVIDFQFYNGFAEIQKRKSIESLHNAFTMAHANGRPLEISTKSTSQLGVALSAFNLKVLMKSGNSLPLEAVFQASKVFEGGGPYLDLMTKYPWEAKKDSRLKDSGAIVAFHLEGATFPLEPKTFFYDWLYVNALNENRELADQLCQFNAFTDIEFNPNKSINCQARSAAIFVSVSKMGLLNDALKSPDHFKALIYGDGATKNDENSQISLF